MGKTSLSQCFDAFGVTPKNPRWSWSGRSADGKVVVVTLWLDDFTDRGMRYLSRAKEGGSDWLKRPGNRERLENLRWAQQHCDGRFSVIIAVPTHRDKQPRSIKECYPKPDMTMRVIEIQDSGEFTAELCREG